MRPANTTLGLVLLSLSLGSLTAGTGCSGGAPAAPGCDPLMGEGAPCALPWPSNLYLSADATRKTGYTLRFAPTTLPSGRMGLHVDPAAYARLDGYSVGTPIMVWFPDLDTSGLATEDHIEKSLDPAAQVLLYEVSGTTLTRVPYWTELDQHAATNLARQMLFVRPAVILKEATRYVVAFRGLKGKTGSVLAPSSAFSALMSGHAGADLALRQDRFNQVFSLLEAQGVQRSSLTLAWDFVTSSSDAVHGDLLRMRDDALQQVGAMGPKLTVAKVTEYTTQQDPNLALDVQGTFEVPNYLEPVTISGLGLWRLHRDASGQVASVGTRTAPFWVRVPHSAVAGPPHGLVQYGHGLLGDGSEVQAGYNSKIANDHQVIFFAGSLTGMDSDDVPAVLGILQEMSRFSSLTSRLHQGLVEWVLLARAMRAQLAGLDALKAHGVTVNQGELYYSGISQGGIFGGAYVALSPDIQRAHLGVPGNNYSLLLHRSVDFAQELNILQSFYADPADQAILLSCMQLLWDVADPVSHYRHLIKEPYPGNQPKSVLLGPAKGDWQVAVISNEVLARSGLGLSIMANYDAQRTPYGITQQPYGPSGYSGSGIVLWDFGNAWPPIGNLPPMDPADDPHEKPRRQDSHNQQMVTFMRTGNIIDVCNGKGCHFTCTKPDDANTCTMK